MKKGLLFLVITMFIFLVIGCGKTYKVTIYDSEGNIYQVLDSKDIVLPTMPDLDGYDFAGFDKELPEKITEDISLYPVYVQKEYYVTFVNGDNSTLEIVKVKHGEKVEPTAKVPTKEGMAFVNWDFDFTKAITQNEIINPVFTEKICVVEFYCLDELIKTVEIKAGTSLDGPNVEVLGYRFVGWDKDLSNITSDLVVTAIMEKGYIVTFLDKYGNVLSKITAFNVDDIKYGIPEVPYHNFTGWSPEVNELNSDITLQAIYEVSNVNLDKSSAEYWIRENAKKYDVKKELLTLDEINKINQDNIIGAYSKTLVVDVTKIDDVINRSFVESAINKYTNITKYTLYNEDGTVNNDSSSILNNRNMSGISNNVTVSFGIVTDFARLRSYPTNCYSKDKEMDQFQETSLNIGEGVAIYHTSLDGKWYFVQATNYAGWVEAKNIATCNKQTMIDFINTSNKVVVIANYVVIDGHHVRMGQAFPYEGEEDNKYVIKFPVRKTDGTLDYVSYKVADNNDFNLGYLPYTLENMLRQAFKILGMTYSWGDKYESGRDCSSTQNAILACFGFKMPRNTSNQRSIPTYSKQLSSLSGAVLKANYRPGTLIFSSGHVMLYIGVDENNNPYILHNTTGNYKKCIVQNYNEYTNTIIAALSLYKPN